MKPIKNHKTSFIWLTVAVSMACNGILHGQRPKTLQEAGLKIGEKLPAELMVYDVDKNKVKLSSVLAGSYTVIVSGCLTCPIFMRTYPKIEAVYHDYKSKGVKFHYLYKTLIHPENNGYVQPYTIEERFAHVEEATEKFATQVPWLVDPMSNEVSNTFGVTPNSEFLFDPDGKIVYMKYWSDGDKLRKALEKALGPADTKTDVASLGLPKLIRQSTTAQGIVPRVEVDELLIPIKVNPIMEGTTFYVKLIAEVNDDLLTSGSGKMYIGFHLDPIHHVHWNNLAAPLEYWVNSPEGITITPATDKGPVVEPASDIDPREFLVDVKDWDKEKPLELTVNYFACDEDDKWCIPVTQHYALKLERDKFAGGVFDRSFR